MKSAADTAAEMGDARRLCQVPAGIECIVHQINTSSQSIQPNVGNPLTDRDYEALERSWIDRTTADQAQLRRVDDLDGAELLGRKPSDHCGGILFRYFWPGEAHNQLDIIRRDIADFTYEDGKRKEVGKYLAPIESRNHLYFHRMTLPAWLSEADIPIVITEGEKKTLALWRLAFHGLSETQDLPRFLPIGLRGVYGYRGKIARELLEDGRYQPVKGPLPEMDLIEWEMRRVTILFDANVRTNMQVRSARRDLAEYLTGRGAQVFFAIPPKREGINGVDDHLAADGPDKVLKLINEAKGPIPANKSSAADQAAKEEQLYEGVEWLQGLDEKLYAVVTENDHRRTLLLGSRSFRSWLIRKLCQVNGRSPSASTIQDALNHCTAMADQQPSTAEVGVRVLQGDAGVVFLDLCNEHSEAVRIDSAGWRVVRNPPVHFRKPRGLQPLPAPLPDGDLKALKRLCNAPDDRTFILICSWLLGSLSPSGPYPILVLQGEQGSAKSTTAKILRSLVDPAKPAVRAMPREERDLMIAANNNWIQNFDNISAMPAWLMDAQCRISTGGGFATRELHSDNEETLFDAKRPQILNGIDDIATQADFMDRCIVVTLPVIPDQSRILEEDLWKEFDDLRPRILGALLNAVSMAVKFAPTIQLPAYPRMADFTRWICGACKGGRLPFSADRFLKTYAQNRDESIGVSIEASPLASSIVHISNEPSWQGWEGTATELLDDLNKHASESVQKNRRWPRDVRSLGGQLRRITPLLRQQGINIEFQRSDHGRQRVISIQKNGAK